MSQFLVRIEQGIIRGVSGNLLSLLTPGCREILVRSTWPSRGAPTHQISMEGTKIGNRRTSPSRSSLLVNAYLASLESGFSAAFFAVGAPARVEEKETPESGITRTQNRQATLDLFCCAQRFFISSERCFRAGWAHGLTLRSRLSVPGCPALLHGFRDAPACGCVHTTPLLAGCWRRRFRFRGTTAAGSGW